MCHLFWLLNFFRFLTFTLKAEPPVFRCFDAASLSFQAGLRARRDLVMYNWCGLAEEGEEDEEEGGRFGTTPTQREQTRVGFFSEEGRKETSVEHISLCWSEVCLSPACVAAPAATNLPLRVAAEHFVLPNEWSCFLPCWNTTLLWEPRKCRATYRSSYW